MFGFNRCAMASRSLKDGGYALFLVLCLEDLGIHGNNS
jgi:hypothetical protein